MSTVQKLERELGYVLDNSRWINLGGGYLIDEAESLQPLCETIHSLRSSYGLEVFVEPGAALARAAGGDEAKLIDACITTEGASDPLMLPHPDRVLWASREGRVVREMPSLPRAEVIGGFWGAPIATDPQDTDFPDISDLVDRMLPDFGLEELAEIASASAHRCTALRGPSDDPTETLALSLGALGW